LRKRALPLVVSVVAVAAFAEPAGAADHAQVIDENTLTEIRQLYRDLIAAENRHDIDAMSRLLWESQDALFVAKTATAAEGNWAGFWGTETVLQHLDELYKAGAFHIDLDFEKEKIVALSRDVAQTYVPVTITVAYAGQVPEPKPFLMILEWVHTPQGWRMATDIALPIPPAPTHEKR
jgi:Domain of unknown function (DUF4440)